MTRWLAGLMLIASAGCGGDDPQGPPPVQMIEAVVVIDWPLAREPGFVDASWGFTEWPFPDSTSTFGSGSIPPSGMTEYRFDTECGPSGTATFFMNLTGHFTEYVDDPRAAADNYVCSMWDGFSFYDCDNPEVVIIEPKYHQNPTTQWNGWCIPRPLG